MKSTSPINPLYAARHFRPSTSPATQKPPSRYARLPLPPRNASLVPRLTSLYHFTNPGEYGDRRYPGNCGGNLIRDLLLYFRPRNVFDPMTGSGTCRDVCRELSIPCLSRDIREGFNAADPDGLMGLNPDSGFDLIWAHPPYWRQKLYTSDPADLSRAPTVEAFVAGYGAFIRTCADLLSSRGKLVILMGDYSDRQAGFVPLTYYTKHLALEAGLLQSCTDIIRFSHGASSSR
ncbi:MAG: hypothetical protein JWR69_3367 [Pedosphaera sp.]|nr:hypothetical protein [Pedosphaera sp.]